MQEIIGLSFVKIIIHRLMTSYLILINLEKKNITYFKLTNIIGPAFCWSYKIYILFLNCSHENNSHVIAVNKKNNSHVVRFILIKKYKINIKELCKKYAQYLKG